MRGQLQRRQLSRSRHGHGPGRRHQLPGGNEQGQRTDRRGYAQGPLPPGQGLRHRQRLPAQCLPREQLQPRRQRHRPVSDGRCAIRRHPQIRLFPHRHQRNARPHDVLPARSGCCKQLHAGRDRRLHPARRQERRTHSGRCLLRRHPEPARLLRSLQGAGLRRQAELGKLHGQQRHQLRRRPALRQPARQRATARHGCAEKHAVQLPRRRQPGEFHRRRHHLRQRRRPHAVRPHPAPIIGAGHCALHRGRRHLHPRRIAHAYGRRLRPARRL